MESWMRRIRSPSVAGVAALSLLTVRPGWAQDPHVHGEHQHTADATAAPEAPAVPTTIEELGSEMVRVAVNRDERFADVILGPIALPHTMTPLRTPIQLVELPVEGWLHGFEWTMVDEAGNALPDELLHHVNLIDPDRRDVFSPIARRVVAAGRETRRHKFPGLIGYPVQSGTRLLLVGMFDNPTDTDYPEAYLRVRLFYSTDGMIDPMSVYPFYMDVMGPVGEKGFPVPPGRTERSWEGSPAIDVRVLGIGGHLHDYATSLRLVNVTTGEVLWNADIDLDESGRLEKVGADYLWWRGGMKLYSKHTYRITVVYDNPTDQPTAHGGMGVVAGVALGSEDRWPAFDRTDPDYLEDLRNVLAAPHRGGGGHGH